LTADDSGPRPLLACALHLALTLLLFGPILFGGRVPYFRDISSTFHPDGVFVADALRKGVWPLWNPTLDAGSPYLLAYPVELALLALTGARGALALSPALHVWMAMCGVTLLAREVGASRRGAWFAGAVFGLSGLLQSSLNLAPLAHATAWAPWVVALHLRTWRRPSARNAGLLALLAALQASTLAVEVALQTLLAACALTPTLPRAPQWRALGAAAVVALLLAAPAWAGALALVEGSARGAGFASGVVLSWSAHPAFLAGLAWPSFLGDPHTMTNAGFWGQPFFPDGYPYFVSLYLGPAVLALAACAGRAASRLWVLAAAGITVALGAYGPLAGALPALVSHFRVPAKALFLTTLALALLSGLGLEAALTVRRRAAVFAIGVPSALLLALGLTFAFHPEAASASAGAVWTRLDSPEAAYVLRRLWPSALIQTGLLAAGAAAALLLRHPQRVHLVALCVVADLLVNNGTVDPSAPPDFYALKPEIAAVVEQARAAAPGRWFSYGVGNTPGLHWAPALLARNRDVGLYYMDRQILWARAKTLDGLDGAFDEDRTGFSPARATLTAAESVPARYAAIHERLRRAGVRWVLSFAPLPESLVRERATARVPEIAEPLRLYELETALPRAFWVSDCAIVADEAALAARLADPGFDPSTTALMTAPVPGRACGGAPHDARGAVSWARVDPHTVRLDATGDAGFAVVLEGYHRDWVAYRAGERIDLVRAHDRYWAIPLAGGAAAIEVRYEPRWRVPALAACACGLVGGLILLLWRRLRLTQAPATC
jgi:hypothetical protein